MDLKIDKASRERAAKTLRKSGAPGSRAVSRTAGPSSTFGEKLRETATERIRGELDKLLVEITDQAKEIEKSLTFDSLMEYRELVKKFVGIVVNDLYRVEHKFSVSPTGQKKTMLLVKKIDKALDEMATEFLQRQSNLLGFLERLDEIRGMLMDLYS